MNFQKIHINSNPDEFSKTLIKLYQGSKEDAMICVVLIKSQLNMYEGALNPKWDFWNKVSKILMPDKNEDYQREFLNELINKN